MLREESVVVCLCDDPSDTLQRQAFCNLIYFILEGVFQELEIVVATLLLWLVYCFYDGTDTTLVVWVLSVVTIEKTYTLFGSVLHIDPVLDKVANILDIHELHVVQMAVFLAANSD